MSPCLLLPQKVRGKTYTPVALKCTTVTGCYGKSCFVVVLAELEAGQRNEMIFQTIRRTAYRGGDYALLAIAGWEELPGRLPLNMC